MDESADIEKEGGNAPLINLNDASIKKLIACAKKRGVITYDELNEALPSGQMDSDQIEDITSTLWEMGINIVESAEAGSEDEEAVGTSAEQEAETMDLILDGRIVRIAQVKHTSFGRWRRMKGLESRLFNRFARETAFETYVGFLADGEVSHLNIEASDFTPVPTTTDAHRHEMLDNTIFVVTEATYWWAELQNEECYDPAQLTWAQTIHELPNGSTFPLMVPRYANKTFKFKCPSQPQHPSILSDVTQLLQYSWGEMETLEPCTTDLEPIFSDPLCPTARFRRALSALRSELAAHGIIADDDHLNGFSGRQSVADVEPNVDFLTLNSLSPESDIAKFQMDSISACFDYSVASFANELDPNATEVKWEDGYEHHCRTGSPEITMAEEQTSSLIWYTAASNERMIEAMYTCQSLAPRFGLRVDFDGDVNSAAIVYLDENAE